MSLKVNVHQITTENEANGATTTTTGGDDDDADGGDGGDAQ